MAVFPVQKFIFGHFWNGKKWNLTKKIICEIDLFDFASFLAWTFLNFLAHYVFSWKKNFFENLVLHFHGILICIISIFFSQKNIYLKPLVHLTKLAFAKPCCSHGNENVKPKGKISSCNSRLWTKSARQLAMWSKSWVPVPVKNWKTIHL